MGARYLTDPNHDGWTTVVPDGVEPKDVLGNPKLGLSLPWCIKVDLLETQDGREYFQVLEGSSKGLKANVKMNAHGGSYLIDHNSQTKAGILRLSRRKQMLWYGQQGPFNAFSDFSNPVPVGSHDLEIPDAPHEDYYPESSKYQQVWFRIGHHGDRYLHLGTISHGCATVRPWLPDPKTDMRFRGRTNSELGLPAPAPASPFAKWDDVCRYLMPCRKGDGLSVGTLQVID
ncbi:MAG TPA: hypothetical protein VH325_18625 [Bryobacteraceae bacterium]|jgi:hypothetical protein|nr:hypothetical protein [Bryobacteraceae bacterium]